MDPGRFHNLDDATRDGLMKKYKHFLDYRTGMKFVETNPFADS
jgi:hypothetical protein